jgi:hypothetical protein
MIYSTTSTVSAAAADIVDKAVTAGVSSINSMVYTDQNLQSREPVQNASRHFGISALRATAKIIGGVASAASAVFASSREGAVQMIQKKYGADAGYIAEKTIGTGSNLTSMLVYFDARGISRRVVTKGVQQYNTSVTDEEASEIYEPETVPERQTIFENNDEWLEDQLSRTKTEKSDALITV